MKKRPVLAVWAVALFLFAFGSLGSVMAAETKKTGWATDLEIATASQYICGVSGFKALNSWAVQPTFRVTNLDTGLFGEAFASYGFKGFNTNLATEASLTLGGIQKAWGVTFTEKLTYDDLVKIGTLNNDLIMLSVNADFPQVFGLDSHLLVEADWGTGDLEGGVTYQAGVSRTFENVIAKLPLIGAFNVGGNDGPYGFKPQFISYTRETISTEVKVLGTTFVPQFSAQQKKGHDGIASDAYWVSLALRW